MRAHCAPSAQLRLAKFYWTGADGKEHQTKALAWALIANTGGEKLSSGAVQEYRAQMSAGQIKAAEREAAKFKAHKETVKQ